ncbi:hypothetical protein DM02DRAFT_669263 [Periconia macrospinosa]|uniref:Uncharacterized protein n=1 Tax=Periconia macrospinosa TaxID=97972 RepID=A0A2V1E4I2_9PLEO|nr:hypothetical protein DM02DRAFT_669263 [Periconia macrospinosa]
MGSPQVTPAPALLTRSDFFRGPLTSVFTPPSSCFQLTRSQDNSNFYVGHGADRYFDPSCFPSAKSDLQDIKYWTSYYYSPAICPQGYSTVEIFHTNFPGFEKSDGVPLGPETSAGLCCPSGYGYSAHGHLCSSSISRNQVLSYIHPTTTGQSWNQGSLTTSTASAESIVVGNGIPIWWQKTDEAVLAPVRAAATAPPSTSSSSGTQTSSLKPTGTQTPNDHQGARTTNSKLSIAVGVVVFIVTVLAAILLFLMYRKKSQKKRNALYGTGRSADIINLDGGYHNYHHQGGYDRSASVSPVPPSYYDAKFKYDADAQPKNEFAVGELDASIGTKVAPLELPASSVPRR